MSAHSLQRGLAPFATVPRPLEYTVKPFGKRLRGLTVYSKPMPRATRPKKPALLTCAACGTKGHDAEKSPHGVMLTCTGCERPVCAECCGINADACVACDAKETARSWVRLEMQMAAEELLARVPA
jgi:hypothetical protein